MLQKWFAIELWKRIMVALVLGVIVGHFWGEGAASIKWIGDLFIRLIRMLIIPLIFTTLVSGVVAMGDPKKLGSIGLKTIALYLGTTAVAIVIGLSLAVILQPGAGVDLAGAAPQTLEATKTVAERLYGIIPTNPIEALASGNVLAVIFFSILLGIGILLAGEKASPVAKLFEAGAAVMLKITHMVMEVAPFGVFALIAWIIGIGGMKTLFAVAALGIAVYGGCLLHIFIVYGGIIRFFLKLPAVRFFQGILDAQMVAYSTDSSSATLPVTMSVAEENLGIKKTISSSVLPLGATINMDGTALYVGIVALFAAQAFGISLDFADYLIIGLTTTLVSIGAAGVPSASLFLLAAVLESIGMTAGQTAIIVGFLLPFDRILDMMRTATNVSGDLAVATVVAKTEGEFDEASFRAAPVE
jgi:Na+/H+-dicarboxylate symporter